MAKQKAKNLPDASHVARYCNSQRVEYDPITLQVRGVFPAAFALRPKAKETYLSLAHYEAFAGDMKARSKSVVSYYRSKIQGIKPDSAIACLSVKSVVDAGAARQKKLRVADKSKKDDLAYAGLEGLPLDNSDTVLLEAFANQLCLHVKTVGEIEGW